MSKVPRDARFATRTVHAGLDPDPTYGSVIPPIHQTSTYVQPAPSARWVSSRAGWAPRSPPGWRPSTG